MPRIRADGSTRPKLMDKAGRRELDEADIKDTADWLESFAETGRDERHPDTIGVSRVREPKSIHAEVRGRTGSIAKPKSPAGKPEAPNPYAYTRRGKGRWQQRG